MVESGLASPERDSTANLLAALHNTLQAAFADPSNPTESLATQREQLTTVIAAAHGQPFDERAHKLIDHYKTIVDFMWFGGHSDTLPPALGYFWAGSSGDGDWGDIDFKDDIIDREIFNAITDTLMPIGLGDILLERTAYAEQNQAKIDAAYKSLVDSTPGAKWFEAFNVGIPRAEMPLSAIARAGREAAIQEAAHRRYGPAPHMPSRPHPAAHRLISQQTLRLDEETSLRPRRHNKDDLALQGLIRYVDASLAKRRMSSAPIVSQEYDSESGTVDEFDATNEHIARYNLSAIARDVADESELPLGITADVDTISREFYVDAFRRAYSGLPSHRAVYEAALTDSREGFLNPILSSFNLVRGQRTATALSYLKQVPRNHPFDQDRFRSAVNQYRPHEKIERIEHPTQDGETQERRTLVGTIEKYNNPIPGVMRLLQQAYAEGSLPMTPPDESKADLVIALRNFKGDPHVPGYRLIAADQLQHRYYFSYQPDSDPYKPNTMPISADVKENLAAQYRQAGLRSLAKQVRRSSNLTISGLAGLSQQHSTYTARPPLRPDFSSMLTSIPSFSVFADKNKLRATCGVYTKFGEFSVGEILPPERTYVTGGYVITDESDKISASKHAQLAITDDDNYTVTSIIEWTAAAEGNPSREYIGGVEGKGVDTFHRIPPSASSKERALGPLLTIKEQVEASTRQLLMQLGVAIAPGVAEAIPADYIYGKVRSLGARHPIAKTLGVLLRTADVLKGSDELAPQHIAEYMGVLAIIADLRRRDRSGANHPQLDMLEAAIVPIVRFGEKVSGR
jgi:hypothetical protein